VLLFGAVGYIYLVDLRVRKLLSALNGLEPMVGQFSEAVDKSETSLSKFKLATVDKKAEDANGEKKVIFESSRKSIGVNVGRIPMPGKSELVQSFFETARKQKL